MSPLADALAPLLQWHSFLLAWIGPPGPDGKQPKHAVDPHTMRYPVDAHDPAHWLDYETAVALRDAMGEPFAVGFRMAPEHRLWCLDMDGVAEPGGWSAEAQRLCSLLPGACIEVSQSGKGLHVWGTWPDGERPVHRTRPNRLYAGGAGLELYTADRFIVLGRDHVGSAAAAPGLGPLLEIFAEVDAVTVGDWREGPVPEWSGPADDESLLAAAMRSGSAQGAFTGKAAFADLWTANAEVLGRNYPDPGGGRPYGASEVDLALALALAFWTGKDCPRIERLMRQSALYREKWDNHRTYLHDTIAAAVGRVSAVLGGRKAVAESLSFAAAAAGAIRSNVAAVYDALRSPEAGVSLAMDRFLDRVVIRRGDHVRPFEDVDYGRLIAEFERRGFKPVAKEVMRTCVYMCADDNKFDSAIEWGNSLVWDGVPRVRGCMTRYYGVAPGPYADAVGEYLWSALAGRMLSPGCQADMALVLVGLQGDRKTSAISSLAPTPEAFTGVSLEKRDEDLSRKLRGKLVIELAEMRGVGSARDQEGIKDWITRRYEEWTPKYQEMGTRFARRCIFIGTANDPELLDDPTGERRWLPMMATRADVDAIERDRDQLWAEGIAMWRDGGIRWQAAEQLAKAEHAKFKVHDDWADKISEWLSRGDPLSGKLNSGGPVILHQLALGALGLGPERLGMGEQKRIGKILRSLNYEKKLIWLAGDAKPVKRWVLTP